jgi:hypothetical protein
LGIESVATPGELCNRTAELLGFQPNTTAIAWRALRENLQVTTGGRGKSAAHCVAADAANLLIATIGKLPLKSYLKSWERFSRLRERGDAARPRSKRVEVTSLTSEISTLKAGHSFQEGLTALIASAMSGSLQKFLQDVIDPDGIVQTGFVQVKFIGPYPQAMINIHKNNEKTSVGLSLDYSDIPTDTADAIKWSDNGFEPDESGDLKQVMIVGDKTIIGLGELLRTEGGSN